MPITFVSGLPGAGKTLFTLYWVEKLRKESGRAVYYWGIKDLKLDWTPLSDPTTWTDCPDGSLIVMDECYEVFEKVPPGSKQPNFVKELAKHRHRGFDFYLIAQKPQDQVNHFVRGLVQEHIHVTRLVGSNQVRINRWPSGLGNIDDYHSRKASTTELLSYPKEVFDWYTSAELHTVKRKLPWKQIIVIVGGGLLIPILVYSGWQALKPDGVAAAAPGAPRGPLPGMPMARSSPVMDANAFRPVVAGIPYTAPAFADGLKVSETPVIAGCGVLKIGHVTQCRCTDQQGNTVDLEKRQCMAYFERGAFNPMGKDRYPVIEPYVPRLPDFAHGEDAPPARAHAQAGAERGSKDSVDGESGS